MTGPPTVARTPAAVSRGERWQRWTYRHRQAVEAWLILVPVLLYYAIFSVVPVVLNLAVSFTNWSGIGAPNWVGPANYLRYLRAPYPLIIFNTALFAVGSLVIQTVVGFLVAVLLNLRVRGLGWHRTLWYIPTVTSAAIMAQLALIFIAPSNGVLNSILAALGISPVVWTVNGNLMRGFIIVFTLWRGIGGSIVLFLAALAGIHPELYEAAAVDGATGPRMLRYITIPLLKPMFLFVMVTGIISGFQIFEAVQLITKGGPSNQTNVMVYQMYNDAFANFNVGVASAGSVVMTLILLWCSIIAMRMMAQEKGD